MKFKVIATSVIRTSRPKKSHGCLYLIDMAKKDFCEVLSWTEKIEYSGRGYERGLRGIACYDGSVYVASDKQIQIFDTRFKEVGTIASEYFKDIHEIFIRDGKLYITSTAFDAILIYNLQDERFERGLLKRKDQRIREFDPEKTRQIEKKSTNHLNSVYVDKEENIYMAGTMMDKMVVVNGDEERVYAFLPLGSHNARPFKDGLIMNDTASQNIAYHDLKGKQVKVWKVKEFKKKEIKFYRSDKIAKPGWARGLCFYENYIIGGSSPSNISVFDFDGACINNITLTNDVRNCIHGLAIFPY